MPEISKILHKTNQQQIDENETKSIEVLVLGIFFGLTVIAIIGLFSLMFEIEYASRRLLLAIALLFIFLIIQYNQIKKDLARIKKNKQEIVENQRKQVQEEEIEKV